MCGSGTDAKVSIDTIVPLVRLPRRGVIQALFKANLIQHPGGG